MARSLNVGVRSATVATSLAPAVAWLFELAKRSSRC
jgi:hypothetical protein